MKRLDRTHTHTHTHTHTRSRGLISFVSIRRIMIGENKEKYLSLCLYFFVWFFELF